MNTQHSHAEQQVNHGISLTLFMLDTPLTEGQHLRVAVSHTEILLTEHSRTIWGSNVTQFPYLQERAHLSGREVKTLFSLFTWREFKPTSRA